VPFYNKFKIIFEITASGLVQKTLEKLMGKAMALDKNLVVTAWR
jgi:hypothetical protein